VEGGAENPVSHLLIVNNDPRLGEERDKTISNAKLGSRLPAIVSTSCTPKVKRGTICLELSHMLNHRSHGNPSRPDAPNERVIDINVNDHGSSRWS
jgi:hypothetical protein